MTDPDVSTRPGRDAAAGVGSAPRVRASAAELTRDWGAVLLLAWAPLPFGSARPWAWSLIGLVVVMLLSISAVAALSNRRTPSLSLLYVPAALSVVVVAWIVLQSWPGGLFGLHHPLWDEAINVSGVHPVVSIAIDREEARVHLFRLLSYAGVFWVAWQAGQRRQGAALILRALALIGACYAAYGIVEYASSDPQILWYSKWTYREDATSTFVNRNSFATFAGLGLVANLALFADAMMTRVDASSPRTVTLSMIENLVARAKWAIAGLVVVGTALLLSHSRGGSSSALCGIAAFIALTVIAPSLRSRRLALFGLILAVGSVLLFLASGHGLVARFAETPIEGDARNDIYRAMFRAIDDNSLTGSGLGSFRSIYPMYQGTTFDGVMDFAHNDYLENVLDLGLPASVLLYGSLALLVGACVVGVVRRRRDAIFPCTAVAASVVVAAHALVDFSMQIPAVAITYAAILGVGVAQSTSSRRSS